MKTSDLKSLCENLIQTFKAATTDESTPPDIATTTLVSFFGLLIPSEFII